MNNKNPKVLIGILTWNRKQILSECIKFVKNLDYDNYDVIIFNNGSNDGTVELCNKEFPEIKVVNIARNLGAAGGRNVIFRYFLNGRWGYLLTLDCDIFLDRLFLKILVNFLEMTPSAGIVGPSVYLYENHEENYFRGGVKLSWVRGGFFKSSTINYCKKEDISYQEMESIPMGCSLIRRACIEKAGFIENKFFIYYEESDWHVKVRKAGFKIVYVSEAKVWEYLQIKKKVNEQKEEIELPYFYYYRNRNRMLFVYRNAPRVKFFLFCLYFFLYDLPYHILLTLYLSKQYEQLRASIIGVCDFLRGRFGERNLNPRLLKQPLYKTFTLKLIDRVVDALIILHRNIRFFIKKALRIKLKILVQLYWNLGDEIMAIPIYKAIKEKYPHSLIIAKVRYPELLLGNPYVDKINEDVKGYDKVMTIKGENRCENRLVYLGRKLKLKIKDVIPRIYIQDEKIIITKLLGGSFDKKNKVAISTGANWKSRQWGIDNFKKVAEYLITKHSIQIVELGRDCEYMGLGINLINCTSIREVAIILKQCNLFIGNDSGLMHMAMAVGIPTVALFGPLDPECLVSNMNPNFIALKADINCQGCWSRGLMLYPDCCPRSEPVCMDSIGIERVINAIDGIFTKESRLNQYVNI